MEKQRTIQKEVSLKGAGIHTANPVEVIFKPADVDSGVNFIRTDLADKPLIRASVEYLLPQASSLRRTSIGREGTEIHTVEHLLAALAGLGIDNIRVEINNNELPALDGSSCGFVEALIKAGIKEQEKARPYYSIKEPIFVEEDGSSIVAVPCAEFRISYTVSYEHAILKVQFLELTLNPEVFKSQLCRARTFCLEEESAELRQQGLGRGATYDNTIVLSKRGVIKNKLRFEDEFIRHKMLDLLGDLYVLGQPLKGHIIAVKSGHALNLKLLKKIEEQRKRYALGGVGVDYQPQGESELDREMIMKILPHRPPFLFIDKILSLEVGKRAVGLKYLSMDDYFFKGHFPGRPVMPGVLIVEAMAQVGGVMMLAPQENRGKLAYFLAADNIKFRKTVVPGDELILEVQAGRIKSKTGQVHGRALVGEKVVAEADLMFALVEA